MRILDALIALVDDAVGLPETPERTRAVKTIKRLIARKQLKAEEREKRRKANAGVVAPIQYADGKTPEGYICSDCGASGVRLYREYQTFLENQHLRCRACACKKQHRGPDNHSEYSIGWLVAAVPTEDGLTFWGYTSVPDDGVKWWDNLPKR